MKGKRTEYTVRQVAHPASWGVDFIKVDDVCVKYAVMNDEWMLTYGGDEIEIIRRAIDQCGRAIVVVSNNLFLSIFRGTQSSIGKRTTSM